MEVNYKNPISYNTAKLPIRQPLIITGLMAGLSMAALLGQAYKIEKINLEGLKPPYMQLSNHICKRKFTTDLHLVKMNKVPPVVLLHHGNDLHTPFWNYRKSVREA